MRHGRRIAVVLGALLAGSTSCVTLDIDAESCRGMRAAAKCGDGSCGVSETVDSCPADCANAKVVSYNLQTVCDDVEQLLTPSSTAEVVEAVRRAREQGKSIKVVGRLHTSNAQICNDGVIVSTEKLNRPLGIETFEGVETVVTEPGIRYGDLTDWLDSRGHSFGFAVLGTRDPTIAGAIATGSHGSSPRHPSVLSSRVQSFEVVDAEGEVREYTRGTSDEATWKTLTTSMGLAGIVTKLRIRVEPAFNLSVRVSYESDRKLGAGAGPIDYVEKCDYGQLMWFPGQRKVVKMCGVKTDEPRDPGATNRLLKPDFKRWVRGPAERALHYGSCSDRFNCAALERARYRQMRTSPPLYKEPRGGGTSEPFHSVVGSSNRMMSSELTMAQQGILQHDFELAIPPSRAAEAFAAAREYFDEEEICLPLVGVFVRFSKIEDETWLAHTSASERFEEGGYVTFFEMPLYVPIGISQSEHAAFMARYEEWIRRLIQDFDARPHWAKNDDWVFEMQDANVAYGDRLDTFRATVERLDPTGVFSNEWSVSRGLRAATAGQSEASASLEGP